MNELLLHDSVRTQLEQFINAPGHAIMLLGPEGVGKKTVAEKMAQRLLEIKTDSIIDSSAVIYIETTEKSISIEAIRILQKSLQLKTLGQQPIRRVVIIRSAHLMTIEAQNALLKLLEEPPLDTVFIMTAVAGSVLPTIYSRTQHITIKQPSSKEMMDYFLQKGYSSADISSALRYSGRRLGIISAILSNENHPLLSAVEESKQLLSTSLFHRLGQVDVWLKDKDDLPHKLDTLERLCQAGLNLAIEKDNITLAKRWQRYYQATYDTKASFSYSPNAKLLLTNLFLRLS